MHHVCQVFTETRRGYQILWSSLLTTRPPLQSPPGPFPPFLSRGARRESSAYCNLIPGCFLFQPLTPVETSPEPTAQLSTSLESLASLSLTSSPECSSSESVQTVSWKGKQRRAPQKLVQEKKSKPPVSSKPRSLDVSLTLIKNEVRRQHLMSEILQKVQMKKKRSLFPAPKSRECWSMQTKRLLSLASGENIVCRPMAFKVCIGDGADIALGSWM